MTCVQWGTYPSGSHLGVLGTNVIPLGCAGGPCQTTCADSYVKLIDLLSGAAGVALIALGRKSQWALVLGVILIAFAIVSYAVLPSISIPWVTGPISVGWY